jgi:uncharacterized protein
MLIPDVNVFVSAHRTAGPGHGPVLAWLESALNGGESVGVSELVLSAVVRIVTNRRAFATPTPPELAVEFCAAMRNAPAARIVAPGWQHWDIFADLVRTTHATANLVPDAYLAALALENGATFVTRDRGFARFPGLRVLDPLAD